MRDHTEWPPQSPLSCGVKSSCPRCGEGKLFSGFLKMREECDHCGLDYSFADPADGPAFFVICFGCVPCVIFMTWLELVYQPAYWVHLVTTLPLMLLTCIPPLRFLKGWLIVGQYYHKAEEGQLLRDDEK